MIKAKTQPSLSPNCTTLFHLYAIAMTKPEKREPMTYTHTGTRNISHGRLAFAEPSTLPSLFGLYREVKALWRARRVGICVYPRNFLSFIFNFWLTVFDSVIFVCIFCCCCVSKLLKPMLSRRESPKRCEHATDRAEYCELIMRPKHQIQMIMRVGKPLQTSQKRRQMNTMSEWGNVCTEDDWGVIWFE